MMRMHVHEFILLHSDIVGEYQKGTREVVRLRGDYEECSCGEGQFVPFHSDASIVPCKMVFEIKP